MKKLFKYIMLPILTLVCVFSLAACSCEDDSSGGGNGGGGDNGGNNNIEDTRLWPTKTSFAGYSIDLSNVESLALSNKNESNKNDKQYFVSFDDDNNLKDIIFYREIVTGEEDDEITQEQIAGQVYKLHVTEEFTYISFKSDDVPAAQNETRYFSDFDYINYKCNQYYQSFIIDNSTGKVYSLSDLPLINTIMADNILYVEGEYVSWVGWTKYFYSVKVVGSTLVLTDVCPNKNAKVTNVLVDKYGTIFVNNDSFNDKIGNVVYTTKRAYLGSDGRAFINDADSFTSSPYTFYYYNQYGQKTLLGTNEEVRISNVSGSITTNTYIIKKDILFEVINYGSFSVIRAHYRNGNSYSYWGALPINTVFGATSDRDYSDVYLLQDKIFIAGPYNSTIKSLALIDLGSITSSMRPSNYYPPAPAFELIMENINQISKKGSSSLLLTKESPMGTTIYELYIDETGEIILGAERQIQHDSNIIVIYPLN